MNNYNQKTQSLLGKVNQIISLLDEIRNFIICSYNDNKKNFYDTNYAIFWIEGILNYFDTMTQNNYNLIKKQIKDKITPLDNKNKSKSNVYQKGFGSSSVNKEINISSDNDKLDIFTSKDIQMKNNQIISDFMQFSINFIKDDDIKENETLGIKLFKLANISRNSYNNSNVILSLVYKEYEKEKEKDTIISSPAQFRKDFSNWVKKPKNWQYAKQYFDSFANKLNTNIFHDEKKNIKNYYLNLYKDLLVLYFICELSFPPVKINFNLEEEYFNSKTMIDNFQIGKRHKAKVNFVFFPSLFSNGNYLENGKQFVFNYIYNEKKQTFFIDQNQLLSMTPLLDETKKFYIPKIKEKLKIEIIKNISFTPKFNYPISANANKEFIVHYIDKDSRKANINKSKSSFTLKENEEITKIQFILFNELIEEINY